MQKWFEVYLPLVATLLNQECNRLNLIKWGNIGGSDKYILPSFPRNFPLAALNVSMDTV